MNKLKQITHINLVLVMLISIVAAVTNFYFVPNIRHYTEENRYHEQALKTKVTEMVLPQNVLRNIHTQVIQNENAYKNVDLLRAYHSNLSLLTSLNQSMLESTDHLMAHLIKLNRLTLFMYRQELDELQRALNATQELVEGSNTFVSKSTITQIPVDEINHYKEALSLQIQHFSDVQSRWVDKVIQTMTVFINALFVGLFISFAVFGLIVLRITNRYFKLITESYQALRDHAYDHHKLPKFKPIFKEEHDTLSLIEAVFKENAFTTEIRDVLMTHYIVDDAVENLFEVLSKQIGIDRVGIAFIDYGREKVIAEYGACNYGKILLGPGFEVDFKETSLLKTIKNAEALITSDLDAVLKKRPNSRSLNLLANEGIRSNLILPMTMGEGVFGILFFSSTKPNFFTKEHMRLGKKIVHDVKGLLNRAYFTKVILSKITSSFSRLVDEKDTETGDHIQRMVQYSTIIARGVQKRNLPSYKVTDKFVMGIERNASAHDIGKVGIPDHILKKPGKLTPDEWEIMKTHAAIGSDIFKELREGLKIFDADFYKMSEEIARYHHEKWDGNGYPDGLAGLDIPLSARIVAVADVFDAITSKRVYKEAFELDQSLNIIRDSAGNHLDPVLVDVFFENLEEILSVYHRHFK